MSGKKTWVAAAILCGTMLTGIVIGSVGTLLILKSTFHPKRPEMTNVEMRKEPMVDFMLRRMRRTLELSDEQESAIRKDLKALSESFNALHLSTRDRLKALVDEADVAIKQHLTQEQAKRFESEFMNRRFGDGPMRGERKEWRGPDGPPMMGPDGGFGPPPGEMGPPPDGWTPPPDRDRGE